VLTLRELLISVAGLWVLCCVQSQAHPHRYVDYSSHSSAEQTLRAAPAKTGVDGGIAHLTKRTSGAPDHFAALSGGAPLVVIQQEFYSPISRADAQPKLYRIFPTGLSPPPLSFNLS
jgi:hypothetical protein